MHIGGGLSDGVEDCVHLNEFNIDGCGLNEEARERTSEGEFKNEGEGEDSEDIDVMEVDDILGVYIKTKYYLIMT